MPLADYNVQEFVTEQVNSYIQSNELTFSELKTLILSKSPIPKLHSQIVSILTQAKSSEQMKVKENLEKEAYKKQLDEDRKQIRQDQSVALKDEELKENLSAKLKDNTTQLNTYANELSLLKIQLARLLEVESRQDKTHHHEHEVKHEHQHEHRHNIKSTLVSRDESKTLIEQANKEIEQHQFKIQALVIERNDTHKMMNEIEIRAKERLIAQVERNNREQARIGYNITKQGLRDTLSHERWEQLLNNIQRQHKALEIKCAELIKETEKINYLSFFERLTHHVDHLLRPLAEVEALKGLLKLIKQHLQQEQEVANIRGSLNKKNNMIEDQCNTLDKLKARITSLRQDNPNLTSFNQQLAKRNEELTLSLEQNTKEYQRFLTPTLPLFAVTLLLTIPLILVINGVIPAFTTPILLFTLFASPPALSLLTTLIIGILTAVYAYKAHSDQAEMDSNNLSIENNKNQMSKNTQDLLTLQTSTIPDLEIQIKNDELIRGRLSEELQKSELLLRQTFEQAQGIKPRQLRSSFLDKDNKTPLSEKTNSLSLDDEDVLEEVCAATILN
ncbi:Dot/Icm T4SS effector LegC3/PpeA [Legionella fallonii]|uniref:Kinectin 1 (Kinesin receptor)-substrate of dot/icm secretion system [6 coiled coil domains] n=1 Tax=Legionella fallonii LLAP-10 TaxID=1212491 RepID=A0A098G3S0_9GAMM|nr:Dot/Icm T4SS effector LegC3/PpeA [Legionella fallonii]CEG57122.1 Kinectin 1 (Kinesin receptor)-substrate of dot/icm secretion system [6 coiled coil domains] [Legionella fallonii LLAP-10]